MDVQVGPSSPAPAFGGLSQANPTSNVHYAVADLHHYNANGARKMRKRKAETQDNERLSKRLSLLNLEQNGQKLYVPVEGPQPQPITTSSTSTTTSIPAPLNPIPEDTDAETMQLDDTKHKVYIYNLDDELTSSDDESSSAASPSPITGNDGRLLFLPDIEKHLLQTRIPPSVLANDEGQLAGMQMVLYREPTSLTVPEEHDSVRKAVLEARARVRERQREERGGGMTVMGDVDGGGGSAEPSPMLDDMTMTTAASPWREPGPGPGPGPGLGAGTGDEEDPDAMDVD